MIVVRISHGLGNQMYQYALLLSLKKIYKDIDIKIDTNHYEKDKSHTGYILDKVFGIKECVASEEECRKVYSGCRYYKGFGREGLSFQPLRMLYRRVYSKIGNRRLFYSGFLGPSAVLKVYPHRDNRDECDLSLFSNPGVFLSVHLFFGL